MTKNYQKLLRYDDNINRYLSQKENASEYIRELIIKDMSEQTSLLLKKDQLQQEEKRLKDELINVQMDIDYVDHQIDELNNQSHYRCEGYHDAVETLENLTLVSLKDIEYQARLLDVDVSLFKQWLFDDKFFDRHVH